jgi:hypothetical protein
MNAPLEPAHADFGGSNAGRTLHCPASVGLVRKVPAHLRKSSAYADRGTTCHAAMTLLLLDENPPSLESLVGKTFGDYTLTADDIENYLRPAYAYAAALIDTPGAEYCLDYRVTFPTIPGAFGTLDLAVRIGSTAHIIDFKFGSGVRVLALYPDGVINAQPSYYAAGLRHSRPEFFAGVENIVLTIVQPQSIEPDAEMVSSVEATHAKLDEFIAACGDAWREAHSESPSRKKGGWCRFCPAKVICPEHTGPLLNLAQFALPAVGTVPKQAYLELIARGLDLLDAVKDLRTTFA